MNNFAELDFSSPNKLNLSEFEEKFTESSEGIAAQSEYSKIKRLYKSVFGLMFLVIVAALVMLFTGIHPFMAGFFGAILAFIIASVASGIKDTLNPKYQQRVLAYADKLANNFANSRNNKTGNYFVYGQLGFVYWDDAFAYFTVLDNELLIYPKSSVTEVNRERVHVSSTSTSQTEGASRDTLGTAIGINPMESRKISATTTTNSVNLYQWHFSIMTTFIDKPNLNIVTPDSEYYENAIASAYSVLK